MIWKELRALVDGETLAPSDIATHLDELGVGGEHRRDVYRTIVALESEAKAHFRRQRNAE